MEVHPTWAPIAVNRFRDLVDDKYFEDMRFYSSNRSRYTRFGLGADPEKTSFWNKKPLQDEGAQAEVQLNQRGLVSFWNDAGPTNSRATKLIINFKANAFLDTQGCTPVAYIVRGLEVAQEIFKHMSAEEDLVEKKGNYYLMQWPGLTFIRNVTYLASFDEAAAAMKQAASQHVRVKHYPGPYATLASPKRPAEL